MARWGVKDCTVVWADATGVFDVTLGPGSGTLSVDGIEEDNSEAVAKYDRGVFDGFMEGQDSQQGFSIDLEFDILSLSHAAQDRIMDAIRGTGLWAWTPTSGPTSTDPANQKWAGKLTATFSRGGVVGTLVLPCCRAKASITEDAEGLQLSISGTNYQAPTLT